MPRIACWRCSGVSAAIASCCSREGCGIVVSAGRPAACGDARHLGAQHRQARRVRAGSWLRAPASARARRRCRRPARRAGRDSRARADRPGCRASALLKASTAAGSPCRRPRASAPRPAPTARRDCPARRRRARAPAATSCAMSHRLFGAAALAAGDEGRGGQAGMADLQVEAERQQRDRQRKRGRQEAMQGVGRTRAGVFALASAARMRRSISSARGGGFALAQRARRRARARSRRAGRDRSRARRRSGSVVATRARSSGTSSAPTVAVVRRARRNSSISGPQQRASSACRAPRR